MKPWRLRLLVIAAAAAAGALAWFALGDAPGGVVPARAANVKWTLPRDRPQELAALDKVWEGRAPWRSTAAVVAAEAPPPAPPWLPVGVVGSGKAAQAIFVAAGGPEVRVRPGGSLPDGGKVTRVSPFRVDWIDAKGAKHEQELFADPLPTQNATP